MLERKIQKKLLLYASQFRAIALTGARQTGKTTIIKSCFPEKPYLNFENLDVQSNAQLDPRGFLSAYQKTGAIFDEIQKVPILFNYLQEILDNEKEKGKYILTGSSNFLLQQNISQSLAGRVGYLEMFPLSKDEIPAGAGQNIWNLIFKGSYPEIWSDNLLPEIYYPSYIQSFIERDIWQLINAKNHLRFQQFVKLLASRSGQEWNSLLIGNELGIDSKTVFSWLNFLQISGVVYLLPPFHNNYGKRIIKRPKLYFMDTGIVCNLLGIQSENQLENHPLKGQLFENYVVAEFIKLNSYNIGQNNLYYWRTADGIEIDLLIERGGKTLPIEIKSGMTFQENWWKNIKKWNAISGNESAGVIIYNGEQVLNYSDNRRLINLNQLQTILEF